MIDRPHRFSSARRPAVLIGGLLAAALGSAAKSNISTQGFGFRRDS